MSKPKKLILAITGASGTPYAEAFLQAALDHFDRVYFLSSPTGEKVAHHELANSSLVRAALRGDRMHKKLRRFQSDDLFAPIASGTSAADAMVVLPCSMGTLGRISQGASMNLVERAADVMLKEGLPLIICPRETPFSSIHLRNMLSLSEDGATILPCMPGFYNNPKSLEEIVDFVAGKTLDILGIKDHDLCKRWNSRMT